MSLYQSLATADPGKKVVHGQVSVGAAITTISSNMRKVDAVYISFVSSPSAAHNANSFSTSTNGNVFLEARVMKVAGSAITVSAAASSFSRLSYIIIGDEQPPASTG